MRFRREASFNLNYMTQVFSFAEEDRYGSKKNTKIIREKCIVEESIASFLVRKMKIKYNKKGV